MALVMEDNDICTNWEEIEENSDILDKQLARLKLEKSKREDGILVKKLGNGTDKMLKSNAASVVLDSTTQESLRSAPEPKMTILMRPKESKNGNHHHRKSHSDNKSKNASKTLQQREQEYAEARMRILGDVRFDTEETEGTIETQPMATTTTTSTTTTTTTTTSNLSPAEILKLKIAEAIRADDDKSSSGTTPSANYNGNSSTSSSNTVSSNAGIENNQQHQPHSGRGRNKRSKTKIKTMNPEPTRDFPVHKTDSEFIHRHPRGPDGTSGFINRNTESRT